MRLASAFSILSLAVSSAATAQCTPGGPPNPPATSRTITGIVMDSAHNPLENATVTIRQPRREVKTNGRGIFQLEDLDRGTYEVMVRRIGYDIALQRYVVTDTGGVARFCLLTDPQGLPAMVTSVPRGGLAGVVADTALSLVPGAEVRVLGENMFAHTDSAGAFFFPVKPGQYSVAVKKKGYGQQVIGVTVPKDSGRKVVVWLGPLPRHPNTMANEIEGMRQRILLTPAHRYHRVTAEQLAKSQLSMEQLVRVAARTNVDDGCEAHIAGTTFSLPLYMLDKQEITMLEVIGGPISRRAPRCPGIIAWIKP